MSEAPTPRRRGRPPGAKNRPKEASPNPAALAPPPFEAGASTDPSPPAPLGTTRAALEADRDRLLKAIEVENSKPCDACARSGDPKVHAALQSQLNGVQRMLLRITGETAPTDANLIRSPQYLRLKNELVAVLKKHPAALADVARVFDTAEQ